MPQQDDNDTDERLRRWRLVLGGGSADGTGHTLGGDDIAMDNALTALYGGQGEGSGGYGRGQGGREGGLGASKPNVARWLGDIRKYFPSSVVRVMQRDAVERLNLRQLLMEPELLESVEPDVQLVADLIAMKSVLPGRTKETARRVVRHVVETLRRKLQEPMRQAVSGSLDRAARNPRPRHNEIDWHRTIRANLKHYQPELNTIIPEKRIGCGRKRSALRDIILCIDQSGSMASSVVYASIFGAVMASLHALKTHMVVFDTSVVDLSPHLDDPVELLFGVQLGGGTDINRALTYCQGLVTRPSDTILVLISDLYEGGSRDELLKRVGTLAASGVQIITLLALSDEGAPAFSHEVAEGVAALGVPAFACTPDQFPDLMSAVLRRDDIGQWAAKHNIVTTRGKAR